MNSKDLSSQYNFGDDYFQSSKYSKTNNNNQKKKPISNLTQMKNKKIKKKDKKIKHHNEYTIDKPSFNILDQFYSKQNQVKSQFNKEKQLVEVKVELPPDDELDFAYNDNQYKFKACGNKFIPRYLDSTCLGTHFKELSQLLSDSIYGYKLEQTCKIQELDIDCEVEVECSICKVDSLKLNNIIRRKNYSQLPPELEYHLKRDPDADDSLICQFFQCKEKDCELLLCPYCYLFGVAYKAKKKSHSELLKDAIRGKLISKQFQIYQCKMKKRIFV